MRFFKIVLICLVSIIIVLILLAGYFGLVPGLSSVFGSDKARNLGSTTSDELFSVANTKIAVLRIGDAAVAEKVAYEGVHPVDISFSGDEISSLIAKGKWKYNPVADDFQVKINTDGTVDVAGMLNRKRLDGYLAATGFSSALAYTSKFNFLPEKVPFYLSGSVVVTNNKVDLRLTSAQIGRVPLPMDANSISAVENFVERRISGISGMNISSLDFNNGKMNLKGAFPSKMSF